MYTLMVRYKRLEAPMHKRFVGLAKLVGCLFFVTAILISVSCKSPLDVQAVGYVGLPENQINLDTI